MEGRVLELYHTITSIDESKYETVWDRITNQLKRIKMGVNYKRTNDFQQARMWKNEEVGTTLARDSFRDEGINESKEIIKKFLDVVPNHVSDQVNLR